MALLEVDSVLADSILVHLDCILSLGGEELVLLEITDGVEDLHVVLTVFLQGLVEHVDLLDLHQELAAFRVF